MENKYIEKRKAELQAEFNQLVAETYFEIERLCVKKQNRQRVMEATLAELEKEEKEVKSSNSKSTTTTTPTGKSKSVEA